MSPPRSAAAQSAIEAVAGGIVAFARRHPVVAAPARHPLIVRCGYLFASAAGLVWGAVLSTGSMESKGVIVAAGCPNWAFGRGGTTIGAVYLTRDLVSPAVLTHESVHRDQWRRYGLAFIVLYLAAGAAPLTNRFEIEAGLDNGGYR